MKKILSILLVLTLVLASSTVAFGAENAYITAASGSAQENVTIDIVGQTGGATVYKVEVEWGNLTFQYSEGALNTWNPTDHTLTGATDAGWVTGKTSSTITVTNHSNAAVVIDAYFYNAGNPAKTQTTNGVKVDLTVPEDDAAKLVADDTNTSDGCPKLEIGVAVDTSTAPNVHDGFILDAIVVTVSAAA